MTSLGPPTDRCAPADCVARKLARAPIRQVACARCRQNLVVVMPKSTGPLSQRQQWVSIADNCGPSRKLRNLGAGIAVNPGFSRRTLRQGRAPRSLILTSRVPAAVSQNAERMKGLKSHRAACCRARNSGYCGNIRNQTPGNSRLNGSTWGKPGLFRSFSATRHPVRAGDQTSWRRSGDRRPRQDAIARKGERRGPASVDAVAYRGAARTGCRESRHASKAGTSSMTPVRPSVPARCLRPSERSGIVRYRSGSRP